ncbi:hypothetical protein CCH79_00012652 [Gambusia affinis]|uniref:Cadherin N-terminal domain-containing protein n=1 Tax=Gambusia affinis TaxID=33528 RepID=A0A315VIR9_GAMAF|nr:hypothetical protein CCH79_00012652 [Gambusia affinis]
MWTFGCGIKLLTLFTILTPRAFRYSSCHSHQIWLDVVLLLLKLQLELDGLKPWHQSLHTGHLEKPEYGGLEGPSWCSGCQYRFFLLWTTIEAQTRYTIPEELKPGSVVGNLAKDLGLSLSDIFDRKLRVASEADEQYFSVDPGKGELVREADPELKHMCGCTEPKLRLRFSQ